MTITAVRTESTATTSELYAAFLRDEITTHELPEPAWGPLGKVVYERTYSRDLWQRRSDGSFRLDDAGRRVLADWWAWSRPDESREKETWAETVRRITFGNVGLDETLSPDEAFAEMLDLFTHLYEFKLTPAGRHLWVTGTGTPWTRNCWGAPFGPRTCDHFRFGASRLFEGGGVGSNYSYDQMALTSPILGEISLVARCSTSHTDHAAVAAATNGTLAVGEIEVDEVIAVEDSREGWVNAWCRLIDLASEPGKHSVVLDVTAIRPFGAPLKTFGGTASGPAPLVASSLAMVNVLNAAAHEQRRLSGLEAMLIDHELAAAVVAGGARRSARMSLMSWDSPEVFDFINCKADFVHHWTTNISVEIDDRFRAAYAERDEHAVKVMRALVAGMANNGEPGIVDTGVINRERDQHRGLVIRVTNPCAEATLETEPGDLDAPGSGESCNLGSVNLDAFGTDRAGALHAFELAGRFLYRSTFKPYGDETAARIETRNRRIGAGLYGFQGWLAAHGTKMSQFPDDTARQRDLAAFGDAAYAAACEVADANGTPRPITATAIAPTGSIAQLSGATSGINPVYAPYFIRRVRFGVADPAWKKAQDAGYSVEKDVYADNTMVVEYPSRDGILDRYDESLIEGSFDLDFATYMRIVAAVQTSFCGGVRGQAVSHTAQLEPGTDPSEMIAALEPLLGTLKGVTAFPAISRPLSPLEAISKDDFIEYTRFREAVVGDSNDGSCATGACPTK